MDGKVGLATSWEALNAVLRSMARCTSPLPEPRKTAMQIPGAHLGPPEPNLEGRSKEGNQLVSQSPWLPYTQLPAGLG